MPQIEVTQDEIELLFEALEAWEEVPSQKGFTDAMLNTMLGKNPEGREQAINETMTKGKQEELRRKRRSIMLKAKLIQSLEQGSADGLFNAVGATVELG